MTKKEIKELAKKRMVKVIERELFFKDIEPDIDLHLEGCDEERYYCKEMVRLGTAMLSRIGCSLSFRNRFTYYDLEADCYEFNTESELSDFLDEFDDHSLATDFGDPCL